MRARLTDPRLDGTQPPSSTPQVGQHRAAPGWIQCRHIIVQEDTRHKAERRAAQKHSRTAQAVHRSGSQVRLRCARWRATTCPHTPQSQTHSKTSTTARCRHRTGRHAPKESLTRKQQKYVKCGPRHGGHELAIWQAESYTYKDTHTHTHTRTHKHTPQSQRHSTTSTRLAADPGPDAKTQAQKQTIEWQAQTQAERKRIIHLACVFAALPLGKNSTVLHNGKSAPALLQKTDASRSSALAQRTKAWVAHTNLQK